MIKVKYKIFFKKNWYMRGRTCAWKASNTLWPAHSTYQSNFLRRDWQRNNPDGRGSVNNYKSLPHRQLKISMLKKSISLCKTNTSQLFHAAKLQNLWESNFAKSSHSCFNHDNAQAQFYIFSANNHASVLSSLTFVIEFASSDLVRFF